MCAMPLRTRFDEDPTICCNSMSKWYMNFKRNCKNFCICKLVVFVKIIKLKGCRKAAGSCAAGK